MAEQQPKRIIRSGIHGGRTSWPMVEVAAMLMPKQPPSDMDVAVENARLSLNRPPIIEQIARVRAER